MFSFNFPFVIGFVKNNCTQLQISRLHLTVFNIIGCLENFYVGKSTHAAPGVHIKVELALIYKCGLRNANFKRNVMHESKIIINRVRFQRNFNHPIHHKRKRGGQVSPPY